MPETEVPVVPPKAPERRGLVDTISDSSDGLFPAEAPPPKAPKSQTPPPLVAPDDEELVVGGVKFEMPDGIKTEAAKKSWRHYKQITSKTVTELESKIKDLEGKTSEASVAVTAELQKKLDAITAEREQLAAELGQSNLERTPEFQRHYVAREVQIINDARAGVPPEHAERLAHVMAMPEGGTRTEQLESIIESLPVLQQTELAVALRDLRTVRREKAGAIADWKNQLTQRDAAYTARNQSQQIESDRVFSSQLNTLAAENPIFKQREGDDAYNAALADAVSWAKKLYSGDPSVTQQGRANAALFASTNKLLVGQLIAQQEEMGKMAQQLETFKAKLPQPGGGPSGATREVQPIAGAESMSERIVRMAKSQGFVK